MRKLATLFLAVAVYVLMGIGEAAADDKSNKKQQKPDSIVRCESFAPGYFSANSTAPTSVNLDQCVNGQCSPCIRSLENQGCKIVDVITNVIPEGNLRFGGHSVTFLLSCERP